MPLTPVSRAGALRAAGVVVITGLVALGAACSSEDTVDTIPPPWPSATNQSLDEGPKVPSTSRSPSPESTSTSGTTNRRASTTTSTGR